MASGIFLLDKKLSWIWSVDLAVSEEDMTMVVIWPSLRVMMGPWVLERVAKV